MKTLMKTSALCAMGVLMLAGSAFAQTKDVVRSTNGNVVKNTFENCVLTNFDGANDCLGIAMDRTVYFDFDSATLTPAAKAKLDVLANSVKSGSVKLKIVGFADELGDASYNQGLSHRRAVAVSQYLTSAGVVVAGEEVRGLGETSSHSQCKGTRGAELKACLWRDRRVEVEVAN